MVILLARLCIVTLLQLVKNNDYITSINKKKKKQLMPFCAIEAIDELTEKMYRKDLDGRIIHYWDFNL